MKILLIFPQIEHGVTTVEDKKGWASILLGYPAITLPHLAALTPRKHEIEIINENYDDLDFDADVDLVGITCFTMTAPRVYKIADEFRKRGKAVAL
ncbi:MAG: B12-binding domain-containing radical SAM protein, partial [Candidatus Thermoplasmatota archaeon]|nr:B12-binding domain-containing radical SAM protein [Candidatus Thermoplasmatota archaeon]